MRRLGLAVAALLLSGASAASAAAPPPPPVGVYQDGHGGVCVVVSQQVPQCVGPLG